MTQRRRPTIKEEAEAEGVSTQTVSRVLINRPDVSPETYDRVKQIITDTGYSPNMLARGLTQGRSHVLGVVAYGLDYFGPSRALTGIEQQAAEMGYSIPSGRRSSRVGSPRRRRRGSRCWNPSSSSAKAPGRFATSRIAPANAVRGFSR